jgi:hypothetical protein
MTDAEYQAAKAAYLADARRLLKDKPPQTEAMRDAIEPTLPSVDAPSIDVRSLSDTDYAAARAALLKSKR